MTLTKIIAGGQTGVDRGALDAALEAGFPCGGWCPPGREAGDGVIPDGYPLTEMAQGGYRQRMIQNVLDSDGTLILYFGELKGGTEATLVQCIKRQRPYRLIDAVEVPPSRAARLIQDFLGRYAIARLNVAGPSHRREHRGADYTRQVIKDVIRQRRQRP